ncbi:terpene synthase [Kitasatospora aureofaciens]|uniref:terpene synthase family protein n=1 Tax=Kitasatospora aureofaciens TaxID=1894 RepID=UPI0033E71E31
MPFEARLNPHLDQARTHTAQWARRMGMFDDEYVQWPQRWSGEKFAGADFPLFIALTHPDADARELETVTDWHVALWFVDDLFLPLYRRDHDQETAAAQVERLMRFLPLDALPRPLQPRNPVERAFADLWTGTAATMSPLWRERFTAGVRRFLDGVLWELEHVDHAVTDLIEYLGARRDFGGLQFTAVSLHNDIVSYDREVEEGTIGNNGVEVARRALGVSRREATALIDGLLTARVDTLAHAPAAVPPGAAGFTRSLQEALAGSYLWHEVTGRFGPCGAAAVGRPRGLGTSAAYAFC